MVHAAAWTAIVPIRDFGTAKSRLRVALPARTVSEIARRLAQGAVRALERTPRVGNIIVVSDVYLGRCFPGSRAHFLVQRPGGGLNGAVREGLEAARAIFPSTPRLVIHADLPGITPDEVERLLVGVERSDLDTYVPDRAGTGTTALALLRDSEREVAFGAGSAIRHAGLGYAPALLPPGSVLRNDVDTLDALRALHWGAILDNRSRPPEPIAA